MNKEELKTRLYKYIDEASEEELEEMLFLVKENEVEYKTATKAKNWWEDEEYIKELDRRIEDFETGKDPGIPWEEVHKELFQSRKSKE